MQPEDNVLPSGYILRDRYRIEHTISRGGFGNVYLAQDTRYNRDVAVKEAYYNDEETHRQFKFEAEVLIHTDHRGVVRGFEDFEQGGRFYLVMQYINGQNLEEMQIAHFQTYRGPMPEATVLPLMAKICSATQALHTGSILHRDIKPANIKVNDQGEPILLDLGLAKLYVSPESVTQLAARAFTPGYAPPEQCEENGTTTQLTDVYALGATTYYALTGRQPWESLKRLSELYNRKTDMPHPSELAPNISASTDAVVMRALNLNPAERFPSAQSMQQAIEAAIKQAGVPTLICPNCSFPNEQQADFCANCGTPLRPSRVISPVAVVQSSPLPVASSVVAPPAAPRTNPMPAPILPEPVRPRKPVVPKQPKGLSFTALAVLFLGIFSLCPAGGGLLAFIAIPLALRARRDIARANGRRRGMGILIVGSFFALGGLAWQVYVLIQFFEGKYF